MAKDIVVKIKKDLQYSASKLRKLHKEMKCDWEFEQGNQWDDGDMESLEKRGIKPLTINKIKPIIKLITGIERQSRSDFKAFPEGGEDVLTATIVSRLMKNISKNSRVDIKLSESFKNGCVGGMCFIEPYMDYSYDLINGDMKWRKVSANNVFFDPDFQEYDMSDAKFIIKLSLDLSKDDLRMLFPDDEAKINKIEDGKIDFDRLATGEISRETDDYPIPGEGDQDIGESKERTYDLIDYYYKDLQNRYYVVIPNRGLIKDFETQEEADQLVQQLGEGQTFTRKVPVVKMAQVVGSELMFDDIAWSYPNWRTYPILPFFAEYISEELADYSLRIQGIVRGIKDLNLEFNKRRTQELAHLNSSINSGFDVEKGALDKAEMSKLKKYGSSSGVVIERKKGFQPISRITPMPLSQGHAQLAAENAQDLKEASGVNPDLLANDSQSQSGRAILLKQRQGMVMIQEILDNFSETKRLAGRFILSQLSELFTIESAMRVLGDAFIADNFTVPVNIVLERGLQKVEEGEEEPTDMERAIMLQYPAQNPQDPIFNEEGNPDSGIATIVDTDTASQVIEKILSNQELNKYDVAIGEGPYQETIKMANFMDLKELAQQGVPIPPQALIESSMLEEGEKKKIIQQLAAMSQVAPAEQAQ